MPQKTDKLAQVLAVEKGAKKRSHEEHTRVYQIAQKPALLNGFSKNYKPLSEDGEKFPAESQRVQHTASSLLSAAEKELVPFYDVTLTKDSANCNAKADLVIDGFTVATQVPVTTLLFMEKHLGELQTFIAAIPVLDPSEAWKFDNGANLFKSEPTQTHKTKKVQKPIVLFPATPEQPAQTQLITEDITVGHWEVIKQSGALTPTDKQGYLDRVEKLITAVQKARESANSVDAPDQQIGRAIFDFVLRAGKSA